jgi:hypothetical protein
MEELCRLYVLVLVEAVDSTYRESMVRVLFVL